MHRGEVWWARLPDPAGMRPVVLISREKSIQLRNSVTVVPVTTRIRGIPTEVLLSSAEGMPRPCVANADILRTVSKSVLEKRICSLHPTKVREINRAITFALALES